MSTNKILITQISFLFPDLSTVKNIENIENVLSVYHGVQNVLRTFCERHFVEIKMLQREGAIGFF